MEVEIEAGKKILEQCLSSEEYGKLDTSVIKKIEIFFEDKFNDFLTAKALAETEKTNYNDAKDNYTRQICELNYQLQEFENKLENSKNCVGNLRDEITQLTSEKNSINEILQKYTNELNECRNHRKIVTDERDSLLRMVERKTSEVERLQSELQMIQGQMKAAIEAKCDAVIKYDTVRSKEISLEMKEKRMEQEKMLYANQIKVLTEDLNRNIAEVQSVRRENTIKFMQLQSKLSEKNEEVNILISENSDLKESNTKLNNQLKKLNDKFLTQSTETQRMIDNYKKEMAAKTKLTELYKLNVQSKSDETQELETAVTDMKRMLAEASEQYGKLETTHKAVQVQHEQDLEEKNKVIEELKNELKHANELIQEFKEESVENALGKLAPSAAVVKRLINSDMSLTELYSKYREASEESESLKLENSKLTLQLNTILQELEERAPAIKKQELEYNKLVVSNQELCQQLETMIMEKSAGNHELSEAVAKSSHLERENKKLKLSQNDLARQVCYLLKEMEQIRCGFTNSHHSDQNDLSTDEVISKKLVTFSSIQELQENNQKLILLVRDLSNKLEEIETIQSNINESAYQTKIDTLKKKLLVMQESYDSQTKMLTTYINKCDSLKKMCFEVFTNDDKAAMFTKDGEMMVDGDSTLNRMSNSKNASEIQEQQKRISELEQQLEDLKGQLRKSKDEYEEYIKEKRQNDKVMNEQLDCLRSEVHELTTTNCKLKTSLDYNNEQLKLQNKNIDTYRKQIAALEERKKNYENSTAKQDETIMYLKEEAMNAHRKLSSYEIQVDTLKQEVRVLRDSEARWHAEREGFHRERQTNHLLLNNIEMIKANFERSETEGKARLESRLDECMRETSALRRRLQEEQDNFRQMTADLKRETEKAKARMEEEKTIADQLRNEIQECRQELEQKSKQIQDLSSKLQESLTPSQNDNPIVQANKKARDLEIKLQEANLEIESITKELEKARENALVYCNISTKSEKELMQFMESQKDYKQKAEAEIEKLKSTEQTMQSRINELETQLKLQHTTVQMTQQNVPVELQRLQEDYKLTLEKLNACNMEIRNLREQNKTVANNLQSAEQKYAHEMMLHSADIQELSKMKEEFSKLQEKLSTSTISDTTKDLYEESKKLWDESKKLLEQEKIELEKRIEDLDHQNTVLHDQLQAWSAKQMAEIEDVNMSAQLSESIVADLNSSAMDIDSKGSDKLVEIIKFLRKEKDLALGQVDILKAEKVRILSESQILQKKAEEMEAVLKEEKAKAESEIVTAYKHGEILRKVEMLNAVTDSNRVLREERDTLTSKVKDLSDQLTLAEDEIVPLKEKNRELSTKVDTYMSENTSLRSEAARWRQRANTVLNNKNSEEFKQITNERDNLLKMLNTEKEILKQVNDELQELKSQRTNVDGDLANLQKQLATLTEEKKKFSDEVISLRTQIQAINKELTESKASQIQKDKDLLKLSADLEAKDAALQDIKAKEFQIRGIAKRYKQNYIDLKSKYPDDDSNVGETSGTAGALNTNEESRNQVNELNSEIQTLRQQEESLRKENEEMKSTNEKTKTLLREAKSRILNLTQSKESLQQELNNHKAQFDAFRQSHETIKSKFDETESSLKESVAKLSRENEALRTFNRQVTKPSTSTGVIQEKSTSESASPRTANVKPMSGGSTPNVGQQSATVQPWRGSSGETPLASIRPITVQNTRTAAILPSQIGQGPSTSSSAGPSSAVPGTSSSSSSNTALVPPQQQVHTTGNNIEPMSSSPTSSHTDYMPATSSATVVVVAVQPMGSASAESSTEAEQQQQQQAVALVSPRMESGNVVAAPAQVGPENQQETSNNQPSTSGTASGSTSHNISISHHHASSSNSVTTTHAGGAGASHKRPRETESEAANNTEDGVDKGPVAGPSMTKRTRTEVTESGVEVEYQVPTSSQREYDSITVDSDEEDGCISEENNAEMDEGNGEGENEGYDEGYEQNQEDMDDVEEGDQSNDIDQSNVQAGDNEVETSSENADEIMIEADAQSSQVEAPQIQAISSGSSEVESSWRQAIPSTSAGLSRQQQATLLMLQKGCNETDGGSSEVSQAPQIQKSDLSSQATTSSTTNNVVQQRKVSGGEPIPGPSSEVIPGDSDVTVGELVDANGTGNDDEQPTNAAAVQVVYQSEEEGNRTNDGSLQAPKQKEDGNSDNSKTDQGCSGGVKGESETAQKVPASVVISENSDNMDPTQSAGDRPAPGEAGAEEGEGMDGVTSEGEKVVLEIEDAPEIEEGREAEASTSSLTTRSRANAAAGSSGINRAVTTTPRARGTNQRGHRGGRPTPIIWSGHQGGIQQGSPQRIYAQQPAQPQRGAGRGRRMRRPGANNFSNMRY